MILNAVKQAVENGADVNYDDSKALEISSTNGNSEIVKFLIDNNCKVDSKNNRSLKMAARNGYINIAKILIDNGADVNSLEDQYMRFGTDGMRDELKRYAKFGR